MSRPILITAAVAAALAAAAASGFYLARETRPQLAMATPAAAEPVGEPLYYRDPDGKPAYSLTPKKTADGRDFVAVPAGADVSFEPKPAAEPPMTAQGPRKIKYYRNPMGLPDTSPVPKKDSMGMDYIAVYEGDDSDDGSVKLSPGKIQRTGVKSEAAGLRVIGTVIRAPGTIQLDERRVAVIAMRSDSFVLKVADVTTGSHVVKGQPLIEVYSPAVTSAAAEYLATISSRTTGGDSAYGRGARQRLINLDVPEAVIAEIERSKNVATSIQWTVPRDGIVLERNAIEGMRAQQGGVLFRIADHSVVWALIDVAERDLGEILLGQRILVKARSFPGREFVGKVEVIYPEINRETRTARLRAELQSPDLKLLHDMYVDAEIEVGKRDPVLAVPESAVLDTGTRQTVLVDRGEGRFEPREVKIGQRGGGYVEVREGLRDGEPVVVSANFLIDAESNLKAALKGLAGGQP